MSNNGKIRLALIGAGALANRVHYPSLAEFDDVEMAGLCDLIEEKLRATAGRFQIAHTFTDYKRMLDQLQPDAVYILMPPHQLFDLAVECLQRKLHVFVEKPPGITSEQTRNLARLAEKQGCLTMVGFQRRFAPVTVAVRERVEQRGHLMQCLARFLKSDMAEPYYNGAVDFLTSDIIHAVDNLRWMGGEVKRLVSTVHAFYAEIDNAFNVLMEFENGAAGMLVSNFMVGKRVFAIEMHAHNISAYVEPEDKAVIYRDGQAEGEVLLTMEAARSQEFHKYAGYYAENRHFIDCLKKGALPETNLADAVKTMELVDRIYRYRW
jgi:predicted dehydrogenase